MGFFDWYPYTNWHNINLDWVLERVKEWGELVIANDQAFRDLQEANEAFKEYVRNYLQDLDVQEEINIKLDNMLQSGQLTPYMQPFISAGVTEWLEDHITEPVGVVIDSSLTVAGAAADAKKTGDEIRNNQNRIAYLAPIVGPKAYYLSKNDFVREVGLNRGTDVAYPYTYERHDVISYQEYAIRVKANSTYKVIATVSEKYKNSAQLLIDMYDQSMLDAYNSRSNIDMSLHNIGNGWSGLTQQISSSRINGAGETGVGLKFMVRQSSYTQQIADDFILYSIQVSEILPYGDGETVRYDFVQDKSNVLKQVARENIDAAQNFDVTPQMFGAAGDGVTDDTEAFQNAINTQRNVFVPMKDGQKYLITKTLVLTKYRQAIYGDIINCDWGYGGCIYYTGSNGIAIDFQGSMQGCANLSVYGSGNNNIAIRFKKDHDITNIDGSVINCGIRNFHIAVDHWGRGLAFKRNVIMACDIVLNTTIRNEPRWAEETPNANNVPQTYPEYNGRSLFYVDNRFHVIYDRYLVVNSEDYTSDTETLKQVLNGAVITGNMADLGRGSFEFNAPIKGCIFTNNEFLGVAPDIFFNCLFGCYDSVIANNTIRGLNDSRFNKITMIGKNCFSFSELFNTSIVGNIIEVFKGYCISCNPGSVKLSAITSNVFSDYSRNPSNQNERTAIAISDSENNNISNNTFKTASASNGYMIKSIDVNADVWTGNIFNSNTHMSSSYTPIVEPVTEGSENNIIQSN